MAGEGLAEAIIEGAGIAGTPMGGILSIQGVSGGTGIPIGGTGRDDTDSQAPVATGLTTDVSRLYAFAGVNWNRVREAGDAATQAGVLAAANMLFNPVLVGMNRQREPTADAIAVTGMAAAAGMYWDGATWSRIRSSEPGAPGITELATATSAAAAIITIALGGAVGATTYCSGFAIDGLGATAGSVIAVTLTGLLGGTMTYRITIPAGAGIALARERLIVEFDARPYPASATNTAITLTVPSFGAGNTQAQAYIHGFRKVN